MKAGNFVSGTFKPMQPSQYFVPQALAVHNQVYELRATTYPMDAGTEIQIIENVMSVNVPGMTVLAVETDGASGTVRFQVKANQFEWAALIAILPQLLGPIALLVVGLILVWKIPDWAWAAIPLGIGGGILLYAIMKSKK